MSNDVAFGISVSSDPLSLLQSYEELQFFYLQHYGALFWKVSLYSYVLYTATRRLPMEYIEGVVISQQAQ